MLLMALWCFPRPHWILVSLPVFSDNKCSVYVSYTPWSSISSWSVCSVFNWVSPCGPFFLFLFFFFFGGGVGGVVVLTVAVLHWFSIWRQGDILSTMLWFPSVPGKSGFPFMKQCPKYLNLKSLSAMVASFTYCWRGQAFFKDILHNTNHVY